MPLVLGVTGSIATGKSLLCQHLVERYAVVHADADKVVHRMYDPGKPAFDRIVAEFSREIVGPDGAIDRKILGSKVFGNRERMGALTKAIGDISGEMQRVIDEWRATLPRETVAILEAVNLMEAGYSAWCDATWLVAAEDETALPRLMQRNGFSEGEARQRLASARHWQDRAGGADHVFHNDGTLEDFLAEAGRVLDETKRAFLAGTLPPSQYEGWRVEYEQQMEAQRAGREAAQARSDG
ncbi:MAG: dephospho-CoA kinase [Chloroflexi bacterium]|nr:dephospho-CoA kinase [Chloroflexota bacterium]